MYKILFITHKKGYLDLRQTPHGEGVYMGKYRFYINEQIEDPDFLFVHNKVLRQERTFHIAPQNTFLLTTEPYSVLSYPKHYCHQFGTVCSCQQEIRMPNVIYTPAILPWFVGLEFEAKGSFNVRFNYEDLLAAKPQKTKLLSVVTSNKTFTKGHLERLKFVERLKKHYGDAIDVFGRGYTDFPDKWDVLAPYKYHIAIENSSSPYYWTEKLSDCFLTNTYPLYYGCTNIGDYFTKDALTCIDIHNFEQAIQTIDYVTQNNVFENRQPQLLAAKEQVMGCYNMFNFIVGLCEQKDALLPKTDIVIKPANDFFDFHNFYLYTIGWNISKIRGKLYNMRYHFRNV